MELRYDFGLIFGKVYILLLLEYAMLRTIVGQPGNSSIVCRVKLRQTSIQFSKEAGFDDVGHRLGLTAGARVSVC